MNLINFKYREDFGHEWYVQVLNVKGWSLIQASVSWTEFPSWPYIQIKSGSGSTLSVMFWVYKFGFDIGFCEHTWNFEYLNELDVEAL
jgi:hypothetical protein